MIYAINKQTKEHRVYTDGWDYPDSQWRRVLADPDGWIPWGSGECPLPKATAHEVKLRNGALLSQPEPENWSWSWTGVHCSIIAYRPILDDMQESNAMTQEQSNLGASLKQEDTMHPTDKLAAAREALEAAQREYDKALAEHRAAYPWMHGGAKTLRDLPPEEWRTGDVVECVSHGLLGCTKGASYRIAGFKWVKASLKIIIDDDQNDRIGYRASAFRFRSRP